MASSKIRWNGTTEDSRTTNVIWGVNSYTWGDVSLVIEVAEIVGNSAASRQRRIEQLLQKEPKKKKQLIRLICRVKGEKVYDEEKEVGDIQIKLSDIDLIINEVLGKMKVESKYVI